MNRSLRKLTLVVACVGLSVGLHAQMGRAMPAPMPMQEPGTGVVGFHMEMGGPEDEVIKGQPITAEIVTTYVQTLADGNRITNSSTSFLYRDGEGRTRRETTVMLHGGEEKDAPKVVMINDPVAGTRLIVDDNLHMTHKMKTPHGTKRHGEKQEDRVFLKKGPGPESGSFAFATPAMGAIFGPMRGHGEDQKTEDLGERTIEGVLAKGTRLTSVIPAGAIGNEKPITTFTEVWRSQDLGIDMLKIHNDPWSGEVTTKITTLNRAEPDSALFLPPEGYKVMDGKHGFRVHTFEKELPPPPPPPTQE